MKIAIVALFGIVSSTQLHAEGFPAFQPGEAGRLTRGGYDRVVPARFAADSDDIFMRSMISNYALEGRDGKTGEPTGVFTLNESGAKAAAQEVLATHKNLKGPELSKYMDTYWGKAWGHFDVNRVGSIEVIKAPQLMRFLASDQYMSLGESG